MDEVSTYVAAWREAADRVLTLCQQLDEDDWSAPTDCPGWTVRDVLAHLVHIETALVDGELVAADTSRREVEPEWTRAGVESLRDQTPEALRHQLAAAVLRRASELERLGPIDPGGTPDVTPAGLRWDWATLLRNRAIDVWVHEQDIRRAVDRRGGMQGVSAQLAVRAFASALPYVLGKKVAPPPGTKVAWNVHGPVEVDKVLSINDERRAVPADADAGVTAGLEMDTETFVVLAAGRRGADEVDVLIEGDKVLARRVIDAMGVTP